MSIEIKQLNTTASATVSTLWQLPLTISAAGNVVTVCPKDAKVFVTYGSLGKTRDIQKKNPGYVLKFENSMVVQAQTLDIGQWEIIGTPFRLYQDSVDNSMISVRYDAATGNFIASAPCYGVIVVHPYDYSVRTYEYSPEPSIWDDKSNISVGVAYATYIPPGGDAKHQKIPTIKSCDIPVSGINDNFDRYKISLQTVVNDQGEWHMPKDFAKDTYDPANAYGDGVAGPSKDNGWVRKEVPLEVGRVGLNETSTTFTRNPMPVLLGSATPVSNLILEVPSAAPLEWKKPGKGETSAWDLAAETIPLREKAYNALFADSNIKLERKDASYVAIPETITPPSA